MNILDLLNGLTGVFGIRTEAQPPYKSLSKDGDKELREYQPLIIAKTQDSGPFKQAANKSFRTLASYIFGNNSQRKKLAMTAPVFHIPHQQDWEMQFVMPLKETLTSLPQINGQPIVFEVVGARKLAVIRYNGSADTQMFAQKQTALLEWVNTNNWQTLGEPFHAQYDPPFAIPFLKRNETMVEVQ